MTALLVSTALAAGLIAGAVPATAAQQPTTAVPAAAVAPAVITDPAQFRPGNIISNEVFFDSSTMTAENIYAFLKQRVARCQSGYVCLKDYRLSTTSRAADRYCNAYEGASNESAAQIISKVARACGINPQVLIVTLEKEQGLVTHTWPSSWRYTIAMGQGCPDTSDCDTRYYGFYNQVYGAARQFKIYTENRYFTYYAPGKTWNVRYHPNTSCGSSPVYIENQATANLYYYTPYQPNAASLRAGYGEGDSCSAYGNRNFFKRFTDWFGSTQTRYGALVQGAGRAEVYLLSNGNKHHVPTMDVLTTLRSRLGAVATVPAAYIDDRPSGKPMSRYVHDPRSGTLYLLERDGTKHRFASAAQVTLFGYAFTGYVDVDARVADAFTTGSDVGSFIQVWGKPEAYLVENGQRRHVYDWAAWQYVTRGTSRYLATVDAAAAANIPVGPTYLTPNTLVRAQSSGDVMLVTPTATLVHIPSFSLAADFGATAYRVLPDSALAGRSIASTQLAPIIDCGGEVLIAARGGARVLDGGKPEGVTATALNGADCAGIPRVGGSLAAPVLIQPVSAAEVYVLDKGKLRHVRSYAKLLELNGPRPLTILRWSPDAVARIGVGAPVLADGAFVQFEGRGEVYRVESTGLRHVQSMQTLLKFGGGRIPAIEFLPAAYLPVYVIGAPIP